MTVCKVQIWQFARWQFARRYGIVARYRYSSLHESLQNVDMNAVSKNMMHSVNLIDIWVYVITRVENAWATREKEEKLPSKSFQGPISWCKVPRLSVSKEETLDTSKPFKQEINDRLKACNTYMTSSLLGKDYESYQYSDGTPSAGVWR